MESAKNAKTPAEKRAAMDEIIARLDVTSEKDKVFWSGDKKKARIFAKENGKTILEQTPGGRVIDDWDEINDAFSWDKSNMPPHGWDFWKEVSERYAKGAEGSIDIVQTADKFPGGGPTWRNKEWPVIRDCGKVDSMTIHKIDDAGSIIETMSLDPKNPATDSLSTGV